MPLTVCIFSSVHTALDNRVFYREARSLQRAGYRVILLAVHPSHESRDGIEILPLPRLARWKRPLLWFSLVRQTLATHADIYHFHDPELLFVAPWIRLLSGKPVVYDVHEAVADFIAIKDDLPSPVRRGGAWLFRWLEPLLARMTSGLVFADDQIAAQFGNLSKPKTTLFNFPERSFVEKALQATAAGRPRPPHVLYLGGLKRGRGTGLMLEAFQQVHNAMPSARLLLVGPFAPASLEAEVRAEIGQRGLGDVVTITGAVPFEQVGAYLAQAAVGWIPFPASPKYQKNIPTKLFEYFAYAVPVVSSDLLSVRPFIEPGQTGLLVTPEDSAAHATAILSLLQDPKHASTLAHNAQTVVQSRFTWDEMSPRLLSLYHTLLP